MQVCPKRILKYVTPNGQCPFDNWFDHLRDRRTQAVIATRLNRLAQGNFGYCKSLGAALWELKIDYGPGFRVYFFEDGEAVVILLCGGDKSTQSGDIKKARDYLADYWKE